MKTLRLDMTESPLLSWRALCRRAVGFLRDLPVMDDMWREPDRDQASGNVVDLAGWKDCRRNLHS